MNKDIRDQVLNKARELARTPQTRLQLGKVKFGEDFIQSVRDSRRKLIPFMLQLRQENPDRGYKCYLKYDKLFAGKTLYKLNTDGDDIIPA